MKPYSAELAYPTECGILAERRGQLSARASV